MNDELPNSIKRLRAISPKLNQTTDEANQTIQIVEQFLNNECQLGMPIFVTADKVSGSDHWAEIGYDRLAGKFRIVLRKVWFRRNDEGEIMEDDCGNPLDGREEITPLAECPRGVKLKGITYLPELLKNLASEAESAIVSADETIAAIVEIVSAIKVEGSVETPRLERVAKTTQPRSK